MYTIIAGTNRPDSNTMRVAAEYQRFLADEGVDSQIFSLSELNSFQRDDAFIALEQRYLNHAEKFIFIVPEYNGVFPGIFKLMIDLSDIKSIWYGKKVALTGVATGRSGNLRGLDTLTNVCHYIKLQVLPNKLPLSSISQELSDDRFQIENTINAVKQQIKEFIVY